MKDLFSFLNEVSGNSDFKATLSERGGFITLATLADVVAPSSFRSD